MRISRNKVTNDRSLESKDRRESLWSRIKSGGDVIWIKRMESKGQMERSENMKVLFSQDNQTKMSLFEQTQKEGRM